MDSDERYELAAKIGVRLSDSNFYPDIEAMLGGDDLLRDAFIHLDLHGLINLVPLSTPSRITLVTWPIGFSRPHSDDETHRLCCLMMDGWRRGAMKKINRDLKTGRYRRV